MSNVNKNQQNQIDSEEIKKYVPLHEDLKEHDQDFDSMKRMIEEQNRLKEGKQQK